MKKKKNEVLVIFDPVGNTLDVWFTEPRNAICEEAEEEFLVKKDAKTGEVVGFEKFNVVSEGEGIPPIKVLVKSLAESAAVT